MNRMASEAIGMISIALAIFSLLPGFTPGAMSILGLLMSVFAVVVSLFSVRRCGRKYVVGTLAILIAAVLFVNDTLRIWASYGVPIGFRLSLYAVVFGIAALCWWIGSILGGGKS